MSWKVKENEYFERPMVSGASLRELEDRKDAIIHSLEGRIKDLDKTGLKVYLNNAQHRIKGLEDEIEELSELKEAIKNAQRDNPDEVHCSCVPLLKVRIQELEESKESKDRIIDGYVDKKYELELRIKELEEENKSHVRSIEIWREEYQTEFKRIKELESKEIGCKKVIEEFKNINPKLETRIKELEIEIKHSRNSYQLCFESINKFYDDLQNALVQVDETEAERHRLSKLLIEARVRIVELQDGIKKHPRVNGNDFLLYKLIKKD